MARPLVPLAIFLILTQSLVRLDWQALGGHAGRLWLVALLVGCLVVLCPILLWHLSILVELPVALAVAVMLMGAAPTIVSAPAIALMLGLEAELILVPMVAATAVVPFTLPVLLTWLAGVQVDIDLGALVLRLLLFVGAAFAAAALLRRVVRLEWIKAEGRLLDGIGVLCLATFALGIMDGAAAVLTERPGYFALATVAGFAGNLLLQGLGAGAFAWLGLRPAVSIGLLMGNRNMGLVAAVLADKLAPDTLVFFGIGQLPIYILPWLLAPMYRRLLARG